jgi:hypothetical protein
MRRIHPPVSDPFFLYSMYTCMSSLLSLRSPLPISRSLSVKQSCFSLVYRNTSSFLGFHNWDQERSHMSRTCSLVLSLSTLVPVLPGNRTRPPTCQSTFLLSTSQFRRRYPVSRYWPQFFLQHYHHISNYHSLLSSLHIFHILVPCATQK